MSHKILAIDFDGTIAHHDYPLVKTEVPEASLWIKKFLLYQPKLILFTMRNGSTLQAALRFCDGLGIYFDAVNENIESAKLAEKTGIFSNKVLADWYIDDRAVGCPLIHNTLIHERPYVNWSLVGPWTLQHLKQAA